MSSKENPLVIKTINEMREYRNSLSKKESVGFVPTMGYLHKGHLSLVEQSIKNSQKTIVSIFVNPTQFGENEDFDEYPRDFNSDFALLSNLNVDVIFFPDPREMYPDDYKTFVEVTELSSLYCGKSRPLHFSGVTTIVTKLINIIQPDFMYMGEKDFQQVFILEKMLSELHFTTQIVRCPIIREADGLAMSSRNIYLNPEERKEALCLREALYLVRVHYAKGGRDIKTVEKQMMKLIEKNNGIVDYIAFVNNRSFLPEECLTNDTRVLLAVKIGSTRLIDNIKIGT